MKYSLGIDAGGTYTDAVILRDSDGKIIDHGKARTTYPDLLDGIQEVLDGLDQSFLEKYLWYRSLPLLQPTLFWKVQVIR
nr:hydantoinase/oxoprolinase N-terminal domain-containing protein [Methanohalophilus profundi]